MKHFVKVLSLVILFSACGRSFYKTPLDKLIISLQDEPTFTIILQDMETQGFLTKKYLHQYKIITENNGEPEVHVTDWKEVPENFFWKHENDLGMEIASKSEDGTLSKTPAPPGYGNYVGNEKYGQWVERDGGSFWEFYGKYAMLRSVFYMMGSPIGYGGYYDWNRNYRGYRPYYGSKDTYGRRQYGTYGSNTKKSNPNFFQRQQQKTGWKSSTSQKSPSYDRNRTNSFGSSSYRSRTGSFGK